MRMFDMSNDIHLFADVAGDGRLPLYEAKMIHQFDHRWASYRVEAGKDVADDVSLTDKQDLDYTVTPRYWVDEAEFELRLSGRRDNGWLMGFRDICRSTDERTVIASVLPRAAVGHTMPLFNTSQKPAIEAAFMGNLSAITLDLIARVKVGGIHLTYTHFKQFPVLPPEAYAEQDLVFIVSRVLELTYTARDLQPWAQDLGYDAEPFPFEPERRAILRAELDAWYARAYGLTRDELRYILDPTDVMGEDYPSETFRVLNKNELKRFGEYRTQRLVLEAWDRLMENSEVIETEASSC